MALVDGIVLGGDILPDLHFGSAAFYEDWTNGLDLESSAEPGNRTGKWKAGLYADNWTQYGVTWGYATGSQPDENYIHAAINDESQVYWTPRSPAPSGFNPFSIVNDHLVITSRPVVPADADWARVKKYTRDADGRTVVRSTHLDGSPNVQKNGEPSLSVNYPADYTSGMITTHNRFAMGFGRFRWRAKSPYGADGSSSDFNQQRAIFPAAGWLLEEFKHGRGVNGEQISDTTSYSPGRYYRDANGVKRKGSGTPEIDVDESFGAYLDRVHQTTHLHTGTTRDLVGDASTINVGYDVRGNWTDSGVDIIPRPNGIGVIAFFINGKYTKIVPMSEEIWAPKCIFETEPGARYSITGVTDGIQTHANGDPKFIRWNMLTNLARDGKYPRYLARQRGNSAPAHTEVCSLEMDYCGAFPLLDDNPDSFGISLRGVAHATDSGASFDSSAPPAGGTGGAGGGDGGDGGTANTPTSQSVRVMASADDAEERADGTMRLTSSDLEMTEDAGEQQIGMRFTDIRIPKGATITSARVDFCVDEATSDATALTIEGEDVSSAVSFTASTGNIRGRTRTSASVSWSPGAWSTVGDVQPSADVSSIIQELVDRPDWTAGGAMALLISGTGKRVAKSFDNSPAEAPQLVLAWSNPTDPDTGGGTDPVAADAAGYRPEAGGGIRFRPAF